jgi:hypothetical protein
MRAVLLEGGLEFFFSFSFSSSSFVLRFWISLSSPPGGFFVFLLFACSEDSRFNEIICLWMPIGTGMRIIIVRLVIFRRHTLERAGIFAVRCGGGYSIRIGFMNIICTDVRTLRVDVWASGNFQSNRASRVSRTEHHRKGR